MPSSRIDSASSEIQKSIRVLVVEDDYFVATQLESELLEAGYDVVGIAVSADEALKLAAEKRPTIAIVDIRLVGRRDGIEAAIQMRQRYSIPSIFATAHTDPDTRKRAEAANPIAWFSKPYLPKEILAAIGSAVRPS